MPLTRQRGEVFWSAFEASRDDLDAQKEGQAQQAYSFDYIFARVFSPYEGFVQRREH